MNVKSGKVIFPEKEDIDFKSNKFDFIEKNHPIGSIMITS